MTHRWLHLHLAAPLMAFGGVTIDHVGPTRDYPSASALTGLFANALGWQREDSDAHQALQDRLIFAALAELPEDRLSPLVVTDTQNAKLEKNDKGWTTWGQPEGRAGATYNSPHRRRREYLADQDIRVVLRLTPEASPSLNDLATALDRPARPLFLGRKPCLPSRRLFAGWIEADSPYDALLALAGQGLKGRSVWPDDGTDYPGAKKYDLQDLRNWKSGLHSGARIVFEGTIK